MDSKTLEFILMFIRLLWSHSQKGKIDVPSIREVAQTLKVNELIDEDQFHRLVSSVEEIVKRN